MNTDPTPSPNCAIQDKLGSPKAFVIQVVMTDSAVTNTRVHVPVIEGINFFPSHVAANTIKVERYATTEDALDRSTSGAGSCTSANRGIVAKRANTCNRIIVFVFIINIFVSP